jgi:hypothetical protein
MLKFCSKNAESMYRRTKMLRILTVFTLILGILCYFYTKRPEVTQKCFLNTLYYDWEDRPFGVLIPILDKDKKKPLFCED